MSVKLHYISDLGVSGFSFTKLQIIPDIEGFPFFVQLKSRQLFFVI